MYFWNARKLAEDLRDGRVSERHKCIYLLLFFVVAELVSAVYRIDPQEVNRWVWVDACLMLLVSIWGVFHCYRANRSGDGCGFIGRFVCLSWPVFVRLLVFTLIATIALLVPVTLAGLLPDWPEETNPVDVVVNLILTIVYFLMLGYYIGVASRAPGVDSGGAQGL